MLRRLRLSFAAALLFTTTACQTTDTDVPLSLIDRTEAPMDFSGSGIDVGEFKHGREYSADVYVAEDLFRWFRLETVRNSGFAPLNATRFKDRTSHFEENGILAVGAAKHTETSAGTMWYNFANIPASNGNDAEDIACVYFATLTGHTIDLQLGETGYRSIFHGLHCDHTKRPTDSRFHALLDQVRRIKIR